MNSSSKLAKTTPWWACADHTVRDAHSYEVCMLSHHHHDNINTARLIAAAPDLLAALEAVLAYEEDEVSGPWPQAVAAIKKARGGGDQPK